MKQCLKDIGEKAIKAYSESVREEWVLEWPGQIVLSGSQTHWTTEVSTAISEGKRSRRNFSIHITLWAERYSFETIT